MAGHDYILIDMNYDWATLGVCTTSQPHHPAWSTDCFKLKNNVQYVSILSLDNT